MIHCLFVLMWTIKWNFLVKYISNFLKYFWTGAKVNTIALLRSPVLWFHLKSIIEVLTVGIFIVSIFLIVRSEPCYLHTLKIRNIQYSYCVCALWTHVWKMEIFLEAICLLFLAINLFDLSLFPFKDLLYLISYILLKYWSFCNGSFNIT